MVSIGIDVGLRSVHCVAMGQALNIIATATTLPLTQVGHFCKRYGPDCVAVDAPQCWPAPGTRRLAEMELIRMGIRLFITPSCPERQSRRFYAWMHTGIYVYKILEGLGYMPYLGSVGRYTYIEVVPHATCMILAGNRPSGMTKAGWRRAFLNGLGIQGSLLANLHLVDASLAALTGTYAMAGKYRALGDRQTGFIIIPGRS